MSADIEILVNGELMVAQAQGQSGEGANFVDSYFPTRDGANMTAVDFGRIIIEQQDVANFTERAEQAGLTVETKRQ